MPPANGHSYAFIPVLFAFAMLGACRNEAAVVEGNAQGEGNVANVAAPEPPPLPPAPLMLDRQALLIEAFKARSAAATGDAVSGEQEELDNRRFTFRIRLACSFAPKGSDGMREAVFDAEARRVSLSIAPDISLDIPFVAGTAGEGVEAAEGFWVRRPWLLTPSCAGDGEQAAREIGLVQYYSAEEPRTARRGGRPYEATVTLAEGTEATAPGSWDLVLAGRLRKRPDGRVISCRPPAEGAVPACLVSVEFENVAIEEVATGAIVARWERG